jgi:predicted RNase H-like HicB family nuclease
LDRAGQALPDFAQGGYTHIAMAHELTIIFERSDDGLWVATIPEVPGAFSQGATKDEARENVLDALQELMAARRETALREKTEAAELERLTLLS